MKKECKSEKVKFQGIPRSVRIEEILEYADFEAIFIPDEWRRVSLVAPALAVEDIVTNACDARDLERIRKTTGKKNLKTVMLLGTNAWSSGKGPSGLPELIERGLVEPDIQLNRLKSALRATMQGVFSGAFDGLGNGLGALFGGVFLDSYPFTSLWRFCALVSVAIMVIYPLAEWRAAAASRRTAGGAKHMRHMASLPAPAPMDEKPAKKEADEASPAEAK